MKVRRIFAGALGVMAIASVTVFGATSSAKVAKVAAASCSANIAIEGPFTGPVAQLGLEQLHFAELAVANDNKSLHLNVKLAQDDTQLTPSIATTKTQAIISSNAVAVIGPSGSQEVLAVGPLLEKAGLAAISGSATDPVLTTSGKNKTFFRVVATDAIQGPQDANYIIKVLHPKAVLLINDEEAYSTGLEAVMTPILEKAGIKVNNQGINGTDTGATLANDISSLVTSQLNSSETVTLMPIQEALDAQQFAETAKQQGKVTTVFGTDGTDSPTQFNYPGSYVSNFAPDISTVGSTLDKSLVSGVAKYGPYGAFGVPSYEAADVEMRAIASVCASGATPSRANVLAAIRKTDISAADNPLGEVIKFKADGDLVKSQFYLFHINPKGKYIQIPTT
ncbi:MAG: branched-chain amino acid ABC transporter substrate-binding protein [Solirubrobacteraceae bacterium]